MAAYAIDQRELRDAMEHAIRLLEGNMRLQDVLLQRVEELIHRVTTGNTIVGYPMVESDGPTE
jgi:hypothetical protein